ncbi:hypothetical protein VQ042_25110, partial [Aurantimonas sp. A2-1-M11]|uniref:hypothetical protein n=1 Tax=Aurantimonas sp. A2-1-M11 TaxID=3113712 RepID=UPI002F926850
ACLVPASKPAKNGETPYVQTSFRVRRFNGLAIIQGGLIVIIGLMPSRLESCRAHHFFQSSDCNC